MIIILLAWLFLILKGIRYLKIPNDVIFDKRSSQALRGICAVEIMLGHLGIATESIFLFPNRKAGILFVGVFFALSGYGLSYNASHNTQYKKSFLSKRLLKLLAPACSVYFLGHILRSLASQEALCFSAFINPLNIFNGINWYVWEIMALYILFFFCERLGGIEKYHILLLGCSVLFVCAGFIFQINRPWYGSTLCFWLGIFYYLKKERFREVMVTTHPLLSVGACVMLVTVSIAAFFISGGVIGDLISRNVASMCFVVLVIILLYRFNVENALSIWLGKYSYEIFLFHPLFISVFREYIENDVLFSLVVIVVTILAAYLFKAVEKTGKRILGSIRVLKI